MIFEHVMIKNFRADLAHGEATMTLSMDLTLLVMGARLRVADWMENQMWLTVVLSPSIDATEQLPLIDTSIGTILNEPPPPWAGNEG